MSSFQTGRQYTRAVPIVGLLLAVFLTTMGCGDDPVSVQEPGVIPGESWTVQPSPNNSTLYGIAYAEPRFVAVGFKGAMSVSEDGITWLNGSPGTNRNLYAVAATDSSFVAVGDWEKILSSSEGLYWSFNLVDSGLAFRDVVWDTALGQFVAAGFDGTVARSDDKQLWDIVATGDSLRSIAAGGGQLLAVGDHAAIFTSNDAADWTPQRWDIPPVFTDLHGSVATPGLLAAVGANGTLITSGSGESWFKRALGLNTNLNGIAYSGDRYVVVGDDGLILVSETGAIWETVESGTDRDLNDVCWAGDRFVAVGDAGVILTSP